MRILILSISFCEYVILQANALASLGHEVLVVVPVQLINVTVGSEMENLLSPGVQCFSYDLTKRQKIGLYFELFRKVTVFSPDLLHIHQNGELESIAMILRFWRLPVVLTIHDITTHPGADSQMKIRRRFIKAILVRRAGIIHVHGEMLLDKLLEINPTFACKSFVVPHGTLSLFKHWDKSSPEQEPQTCLFFGRMNKYRGLDNLCKISAALKMKVPAVKIIVAGTGPELTKYKTEMKKQGIFEIHDEFIPNSDIPVFFRRASLLLLPYHEASQSGVVLMGLSFGLPVVATAVGSIPEVIADGVQGCIVDKDDLEGFVDAMVVLLSDPIRLEGMREACLVLAEKFTFTNLAPEFVLLYQKALKQSGKLL